MEPRRIRQRLEEHERTAVAEHLRRRLLLVPFKAIEVAAAHGGDLREQRRAPDLSPRRLVQAWSPTWMLDRRGEP